jgi:hypothetical protein
MNKLWVALAVVTGLGCAGSQAQRVQDARMAEIDEQAKAKLAAIDQRTDARGNGIEAASEQQQANIENSGRPGAEARSDLSEISGERAEYRNDAGGRLDRLSVRLDAADQKVEVLGSRAPSSLHNDIQAAKTQRKLLQQRLSEIQGSDPASWAQDKDSLEQGLNNLDTRINDLTRAIGDV